MNTDHDRPRVGHSDHQEHDQPSGAESPRHLLAVHDPSTRGGTRGRQTAGRGHGVTVQWVRPTELAARIAARTTAGAVAAHTAAQREIRGNVRARLAPLSAFGRHGEAEPVAVGRSVVGR